MSPCCELYISTTHHTSDKQCTNTVRHRKASYAKNLHNNNKTSVL